MIDDKAPVITVDGASGVGKGTISLILAKRLGWKFLDSGALYRLLAFAAIKHHVPLDNETDLEKLALGLAVQFHGKESELPTILLDDVDVTAAIRTEEIGNAASIVAMLPAVRRALLDRQRAFRVFPGLVADGRDMGTIVFPDAALKIFLLASLTERARRRYKQLKERGIDATLDHLLIDVRERDKRDQERLVSPLKPAEDAICIDTDHLTVQQVIDRILLEINQKKAFPAISIPIVENGLSIAV